MRTHVQALMVGCLGVLGVVATACADGDSATSTPSATSSPTEVASPTETPRATRTPAGGTDGIEDVGGANRAKQFIASNFPRNDYDIATVPLDEIVPVLGADAIPSIDEPRFDDVATADGWLDKEEPVVLLEHLGEARAYPLQILTWHEIVNDVVAGDPVLVSYCPLCNTAIVFRRDVAGRTPEFGVSGALRHNDLIMYDRETQTLWQQVTGTAIVGEGAGTELEFLPSQIVSWEDFRDAFPDGLVLNRDTGHGRGYGQNPYPLYDAPGSRLLFSDPDANDTRLDAKERVLTVDLGGDPIAFPFSALSSAFVLTGDSAGQEVVAFWQSGTTSALDEAFLIAGRNVGSAGAFVPELDGVALQFEERDGAIVDRGTGSTWNVLGHAVDGPLAGARLEPVVSANHFWFAWSVFKPNTRVIVD